MVVLKFGWNIINKALPFRAVANGAWLTVELRPSLLSVLYSTEILNVNGNILWCFFDKEGKYGIALLSLW